MPRTGRHPLKTASLKSDPQHKEITVTTITHIPALESYWRESLEVLKLFFWSLINNTEPGFDLMVFDNNSCGEVRDFLIQLQKIGSIQYLVFSEKNLKKLGALNFLLSVAPGEFISYTDSDVYFLKGWLRESISVLSTFPKAGTVTALPLAAGNVPKQRAKYLEQIKNNNKIKIETGDLIPMEYIQAHMESLGRSYNNYPILKDRVDCRLEMDGIRAYLGGADFQFTTRRELVLPFMPLTLQEGDLYHDPIYSPILEARLNKAGYEGFSTNDYLVHHMGNKLPDVNKELHWLAVPVKQPVKPDSSTLKRNLPNPISTRLLKIKFFRNQLKKANSVTYRLLYEE